MRFRSTRGETPEVSLAVAVRQGLALDGGLLVPDRLEPLPGEFWHGLGDRSLVSIAMALGHTFLSDDLGTEQIEEVCRKALDFPIPLVEIEPGIHVLEVFHGPTHAFKDVGARFLARLLTATDRPVSNRRPSRDLTVLVATSGDTGGAVAAAFDGLVGARVAILYPRGYVTPLQEKQITTWGGNVRAFAVDGTFDDCQRLVKRAFADRQLRQQLRLTSANSINIGRLLPQSIYYLWAASQLRQMATARGHSPRPMLTFCVPSGNFGNLTAGLYAKTLGLRARFVAATNANDVVPRYLESGQYDPLPTINTISNAMDVGQPSNFARIRDLYSNDLDRLRRDVEGVVVSDVETRAAIEQVANRTGYVMDPHTAVAYVAASTKHPSSDRVILATAHPAKFRESIQEVLDRPIELPVALQESLVKESRFERIPSDFDELVDRLTRDWPAARDTSGRSGQVGPR